jgi:hypothetical protein
MLPFIVTRAELTDRASALKALQMTGKRHSRPTLIIVCGLPGSGKITYPKQLEQKVQAIHFCPDEWMDALEINLWNEQIRDRIEKLQWTISD